MSQVAVLGGVTLTPGTVVLVVLLVASAFFALTAAVGFYRLPDVYTRSHAASKSETLGALLALAAAAIAFGPSEAVKLGLLALFVLVTGPTAAHAVARAAADSGIEPWVRERPDLRADGSGDEEVPER
ncbi:monovalent cation/H(+) antiporter subunit G [Salinirubellus salinus]|uniref:Monovalent cation/H(+) antiporter subunit G n=1 Tax=Salinirubellus salinus TaxID=1364945 RepID=A0A9E7R4C0_9EURY|nr:monovalent cation/H(+) antiporter subunit G [Salinirubellus salinus]UWM54984.1 monovalent cation/H(+) antiporter subunit G [Salinirubellus salinus]